MRNLVTRYKFAFAVNVMLNLCNEERLIKLLVAC